MKSSPLPLRADCMARNYFSSRVNLKVSLVQRCFLCFHYLLVFSFLLFFLPEFEIIRSCYKFSNYFRGGFNRRLVELSVDFGSGESGQRRETDNGGHCALRAGSILSSFPCRLQIRWFVAYRAPSIEP